MCIRDRGITNYFYELSPQGTLVAWQKENGSSPMHYTVENGDSLSDVSRLDTMVTVVDAANLIKNYSSTDFLKDRAESIGENDDRTLVDLLVEQIEFANVILLNKVDLISKEQLKTVTAIIRGLNTKAKIIETTLSKVELKEVMDTKLYDLEEAQDHPLWAQELHNPDAHVPETDEYGITSFVYRARAPFDPKRIHEFFTQEWPGVIRTKGFFWLSSRPDFVGEISQAGAFVRHKGIGRWWASIPKSEWPDRKAVEDAIGHYWTDNYGDRRQEIVFIGSGIDWPELKSRLDSCLLPEDLASDPNALPNLPDPFQPWGE